MTRDTLDRRKLLKTMAVGAASATIAGCSSGGGGGGGDGDSDGGDETTESSGGDETTESSGGEMMDFGGFMDGVGNYNGVVDKTGQSEVTVKVGTDANGGGFGFGPAAIKISTGTKVVWEWTGKGGGHNVKAEEGASFTSETVSTEGHTFSHTFEEAGTVKYVCVPHKALGMKGAVVVE